MAVRADEDSRGAANGTAIGSEINLYYIQVYFAAANGTAIGSEINLYARVSLCARTSARALSPQHR